jgi:hypothetical protein
MNNYPFTGSRNLALVQLATLIASLLLSLLAIWLHEHPNNDTYTYIRTADLALKHGLASAYAHYEWAHFSVLIGALHKVSGLSLLNAAYVINASLFALVCTSFVSLVANFTQSNRAVWIAAATILVYPHLNEFRPYIIRDIGFLAFMLISFLQLLHYNRTLKLRYSLTFIAATLIATLFRPEALLFLPLAPTALLFNKAHPVSGRRRAWLALQGFTVLLVAVASTLFALGTIDLGEQLQRYSAIYSPFLPNLQQLTGVNTIELNNALFGDYASQFVGNYTGWFLLAGLFALLIACIIDSLGLAVAPLLLFGLWRRHINIPNHANAVFMTYLLVSALILLAFVMLTRFITTRYTLLLCTLLLVMLPLIIDRVWSLAAANARLLRFGIFMSVVAVYATLDAHVSFGASKRHLDLATSWIVQYTRQSAPLLTNEFFIAYQSGRVINYDLTQRIISADTIQASAPGTIVAITPRGNLLEYFEQAVQEGELRLLQRFSAARGADLWVFEKEL